MAEVVLGIVFVLVGIRCIGGVTDAHMPTTAMFWTFGALACFALSAFLFFGG